MIVYMVAPRDYISPLESAVEYVLSSNRNGTLFAEVEKLESTNYPSKARLCVVNTPK
jgi:hypothetical protein